MAKQIKVIKCPQCGNSKPTLIGDQHYRCTRCDVEFFLDNDDQNINVNVNHNHQTRQTYTPSRNNSAGIIVAVVIFVVIAFFFIVGTCVSSSKKKYTRSSTYAASSKKESKDQQLVQMLSLEGKPGAFYLERRQSFLSSDDSNKNGIFAVFYDLKNGKQIKEQRIADANATIDHNYFESEKKHYYIINEQIVYTLDPKNLTLKNVTNDLAQAKPALNSGFSAVYFITPGKGDGLRLKTNLGKEFYYFPSIDILCTDRAFSHLADGGMATLSDGAKDASYYLFLNKESKESSNVAQLMRINYRYNNGGPENKLDKIISSDQKFADKYRIVSVEALTDERICFGAKILYYDNENILILYKPSLAADAVTNVQLLNTKGEIKWTTTVDNKEDYLGAIKTEKGFLLQNEDDKFVEINNDGSKGDSFSIK